MFKGGILLAAYGVRRPTKDTDANAISADVSTEQLIAVVHDVAAVETDDGVMFDLDSISVQEIREHADYPGFRVRVGVTIGPWNGTAAWDVSTRDPIVPAPRRVRLDRVLGEPIVLLGYAPETTIAEKGVTILERGITSTRWRGYVDIVQLARQGIDTDEVLRSARAVARHRGIALEDGKDAHSIWALVDEPATCDDGKGTWSAVSVRQLAQGNLPKPHSVCYLPPCQAREGTYGQSVHPGRDEVPQHEQGIRYVGDPPRLNRGHTDTDDAEGARRAYAEDRRMLDRGWQARQLL